MAESSDGSDGHSRFRDCTTGMGITPAETRFHERPPASPTTRTAGGLRNCCQVGESGARLRQRKGHENTRLGGRVSVREVRHERRIRRFVTGLQSELTRDLLQDMRMLIQEPAWQRTPALKAIKKRKAKKSGGKRKKQDRDEL